MEIRVFNIDILQRQRLIHNLLDIAIKSLAQQGLTQRKSSTIVSPIKYFNVKSEIMQLDNV